MNPLFRYASGCLLAASTFMTATPQTADSTATVVTNAFTFGIGTAHRADTYLTPLHYDGQGITLGYEHFRAMKSRPWLWHFEASLSGDRTLNPPRNSTMYGAQVEGLAGALRRYTVAKGIEAGFGPATTLDAGALYLSRNGNNPVAANASWTVGLGGYAAARFRLGRLPMTAVYRASLPVAGVMFAPDYGQLYYEIYLGDRRGLVAGAWWGRYFRLNQCVTLDIKVRRKNVRLGYGCDVLSTKVRGIVSRRINHEFVLGISTDWLSAPVK